MKKKFLLSFMVVCISIFVLGNVSVWAGYYNSLTYKIENGEVTITRCENYATEVTIPAEIDGLPVTTIGREAFRNRTNLRSISIPNSIVLIDYQAFSGCTGLTTIIWNAENVTCGGNIFDEAGIRGNGIDVIFGDSVKNIPADLFYVATNKPNIRSVTIGNGVTSIGNNAFREIFDLTSIKIGSGVTTIGNSAFRDCGRVTSITIGNGVTTIGDYAFSGCNSLTSIAIPKGVTSISTGVFSGCYSLTNITIPESVTSVGSSAFSGCSGLTSITIPEGVTSVGSSAFSGCSGLTSITIPEGVTSIGSSAFSGCSGLTSITIPEGVTSIGSSAFSGCSGLTNITIPEGVTSIDYFSECSSLTSIVIPEGVTSIGSRAFSNCRGLTNITIPNSVTKVGYNAFSGCSSLTSIALPEGVTSIGEMAFYDCGLTSITIPKGVTSIGDRAFSHCRDLTSITLPEGDTYISGNAFSNSGLINIALPEGITSIGSYAFAYCNGLMNITVPNSVTNIGNYAFYRCSSLKNVNYNGNEEDWNKISIGTNNEPLNNSKINYFWYVTICDKDGKEISRTTQNDGEKLDTSAIAVPNGYALKLYKDKELTQEYSLDTPISENLTLYYDLIEINKLKVSGAESADIGQKGVTYTVSFATDKTAKDFIAAIKYSDKLSLSAITEKDFSITDQSSDTIDGYTYLYLTCTYKNDGNMPANTTLNPFELIFDISESARANDILTVEFVGDETFLANDNGNTYDFDGFGTAAIKVNPIPVKSITINGAEEIDTPTQYTAVISPENATNKEIEWTVDNSEIAVISQDGTLTPQKAGTVKITAAAKDGSGIFGEKTVNVKVYAQMTSLSASAGVWSNAFAPSEREYVIYVPKNTASIKLTAQHQGTLKAGARIFYNGRATTVQLAKNETVLILNYSEAGYTDSIYTVKILKFEGAKTTVSDDGKTFNIKPINVANGNTVILTLYNGEEFAEMQSENYNGTDISFTSDKSYTNAKVMIWNNLDNMTPVCDAETVK